MFKVGDVVVIIMNRNVLSGDEKLVGTKFKIHKVVYDRPNNMYEIYKEFDKSYFIPEELVLKEVYDTPLYHAMREDV